MQTFLPYADLRRSVECLDNKRLGKQRVEAFQILRALSGLTSGWRNHPATRMWSGFESALQCYYNESLLEWENRGYQNKKLVYFPFLDTKTVKMPNWFGDEAFHASHRSALLAKDLNWYEQFKWKEIAVINYIWPVGIESSKT